MKLSRSIRLLTAVLSIGLVVSIHAGAQNFSGNNQTPRYRLIDLGTFGGPASYFPNGFDGILNNHGTAVGWTNTSEPDPFDPFCITPNCFVAHAFQFHNGVLTDLGTLAAGTSSQASWINANGLAVGLSDNGEIDPTVPGFPQIRAVLWRDGQIVDLGTLPEGGFESIANAINNRGQVVGFALNTVPDPFSVVGFPTQTRAFMWQDGVMHDLGTLGGPDAIAGLVNDQGEVSGPSYTATDPQTGAPAAVHPFLWKNGNMIDLGSLGGTDSEPTAMNDRGEVVGLSTLAGDTIRHPFLWSKGKLIDLGTLGGDNGTTNWINNNGDIAGKGDLVGAAPQLHDAVLWSHGKTIDLGVLPGDSCSNAYYVNSHGRVVGTSENLDFCLIPIGQRAFLWEKGGPMMDLNTLIPPGASLELTFAFAINDRGEIAGFGVPPDCAIADIDLCGHAYVLMPCHIGEVCANQTLGHGASATSVLAPSRRVNPQSLHGRPAPRLSNSLHQKLHFPGYHPVPSD